MNIDSHSIINALLLETAKRIIPFRDDVKEQTEIANQLKLLLESKSKYCIPMTKIAGSIGKATTIISSDLDLIVFVRNVSIDEIGLVLENFEALLRSWDRYTVQNIRATKYSVQFSIENHDFDLLPAIDLVPEANVPSDEQMLLQQQRTLDRIDGEDERNVHRYSSSLVFSTVAFMTRQSCVAHDLARLAKFWYKSACIDEYVSGAKYAMELIAVRACSGIRSGIPTENFHLLAFQKFLEDIKYFEHLNIVFDGEYASLEGHQPSKRCDLPLILDPANPYNNLAKAFKPTVIHALKLHATRTLERIYNNQWGVDRASPLNCTFWRIIDIFKPNLFDCIALESGLFGDGDVAVAKARRPFEIRTNLSSKARKYIDFMHICLTAVCKHPAMPSDRLRDRLQQVYKKKKPGMNFYPSAEHHESREVTICLKINDEGAIIYSFNTPRS